MTALPVYSTPAATRMATAAPHLGATVLTTVAFELSLLPTLLPRPALLQAVLTGLLVAVAVGVATRLDRLVRVYLPALDDTLLRWSVLTTALGLGLGGLIVSDGWLAAARHSIGLPQPPDYYWPLALTGAALTTALLLAVSQGIGRLLRRATTARARAGVAMCVLLPVAGGAVGSGSVVSALPFPGDDVKALLAPPSPAGGVRVYVGVDERSTPEARAALAVRRLEQQDAFDREALVVVFPTGTGWVNPEAVAGFERAMHGEVATVAMQGGKAPSWVEMFLNRGAQDASAQALLAAVSEHIAAMPEQRRPDLHLYGESLGALLGQTALSHDSAAAEQVCSVLWAGVPGGEEVDRPRERLLRNPDDPVPFWSLRTAVQRPDAWPDDTPWVPGLSYLTTSLDLVVSLGTEPGHGHRYGPEQSWRLPRCGEPVSGSW